MADTTLRIRRNIMELVEEYKSGANKKPLEDLVRAWKGIKELPIKNADGTPNENSFFVIGGYHGEPFRGAGWGNSAYWGGWCNHGNVLFPTWHRIYMLKLEDALRSIPGCEEVTMAFWDECSQDSLNNGVPSIFTDKTFVLDGVEIPNPLYSYKFPVSIVDNIGSDTPSYTKPKDYETVRYPFSGLRGDAATTLKTIEYNKPFEEGNLATDMLNANVMYWLNKEVVIKQDSGQDKVFTHGVYKDYVNSLNAPNYTVFSNTTSAQEWNNTYNRDDQSLPLITPLESPHNKIHLAVGGCDVPGYDADIDQLPIPGQPGQYYPSADYANGDMGENDTAGLDPIFFFHHCFVDYVFWQWQVRQESTAFDIIPEYPGTNSVDNQGPTPGVLPNSWLDLDSPLTPFKRIDDNGERYYTSVDCFDIETLGYQYGPGSLDELSANESVAFETPGRTLRVSGLSRADVAGSFVISAYMEIDGKDQLIGTEAVLSRWHVAGCANCQTHLQAQAFFELPNFELPESSSEVHALSAERTTEIAEAAPKVKVKITTHDDITTYANRSIVTLPKAHLVNRIRPNATALTVITTNSPARSFRVEFI